MSISALSSISNTDTYDFTNMTSKQAISAAGDLNQKGEMTDEQFATFVGETPALSFSPSGGYQAGSPDPLNSDVKSNYLQLNDETIQWLEKTAGKILRCRNLWLLTSR